MNRSETVTAIAHRLRHLKKRDVNEVLLLLIELWTDELVRPGGYIRIDGLGKLYVEQQTIRSVGAIRDTLLDQGKPVPESLKRCYFRFRPADALRARLRGENTDEEETFE